MRRGHQRHQRHDYWVRAMRGETFGIIHSHDLANWTVDGHAVSSGGRRLLRGLAVAIATAVLAVLSIVMNLDEANASPVTKATTKTSAAATACSVIPASFGGRTYCPGYIVGVKRGVYGIGIRMALRGVTVDGASGTTIVVSGGPSCLQDPTRPPVWCGAIVPSLVVPVAGLAARPRPGDVIDLYGITDSATLKPVGYRVIGYCDPTFGC